MIERRDFLKTAATIAAPLVIPRHVLAAPGRPGANDRILTGVIGCGARSAVLLNQSPGDLQIVALADCDLRQMGNESAFGQSVAGPFSDDFGKWRRYQDYREMLDKEKLDAVFVGTTTHARVLCCIHAAQAGLGIYAEKPLTLTIAEGRALVTAVRKHRCIFQAGTQARSMRLDMWASEFLRSGGLGKIEKVVASNYMGPARRTPTAAQPVPQEMNWDLWCDQAELAPHDPSLYHGCGKWGQWSAYDGGGSSWGVTGWGSHSYDAVQAALGTDNSGPVEVWAAAPSYLMSPVTMRYADGTILEMNLSRQRGPVWGAIFVGQKGKVEINRNRCVSNPPELVAGQPKVFYAQGGADTRPHIENWIECLRTRRQPRADVETAHRSATICHLVNVARDIGRRLRWNPDREMFVGDDEANRHPSVSRPRRASYELPEA
ncbi:MAG: Gfo/Idh/MocA family oxidoreductase [Pirellulaceae bacterium]|nr:Gfo/Idh/MocA family oxidoreductase [Pirellulaceae bacterium]